MKIYKIKAFTYLAIVCACVLCPGALFDVK